MKAPWYKFEVIKDLSWFKGRHLNEKLLNRIDIPSKSDKCLTVDKGKFFLVSAHLNPINQDYKKSEDPSECKLFDIQMIDPINTCKYPLWKVEIANKEYLIRKSSRELWYFFDFVSSNKFLPFCVFDFCKPWFLFLVESLDSVPLKEKRDKEVIANDEQKPRTLVEIIKESSTKKYRLLNREEILNLSKYFGYPEPEKVVTNISHSGTSFPEQAVCFYLRKSLSNKDIISRDQSYGKELDIYIKSMRIGIEYNGKRWHKDREKDKQKYLFFKKIGIRVIEIYEDTEDKQNGDLLYYDYNNGNLKALEHCIKVVFKTLKIPKPNINLNRDQKDIFSQYKTEYILESLGSYYPVINYWWSKRNLPITPFSIKRNSDFEVWLKCPDCDFTWKIKCSKLSYDMNFGICCPKCANQFSNLNNIKDIEAIGFPISLLLPHIDQQVFNVVDKDDSISWNLNGLYPSLVFHNEIFNIDSKNKENSDKIMDVVSRWYWFIQANQFRGAWWHCCSCDKNYYRSYYRYFHEYRCPLCGDKKTEYKDILGLNFLIERHKEQSRNKRDGLLQKKFKEYVASYDGSEYPTLDSLCEFINKGLNIFESFDFYSLKKSENIMSWLKTNQFTYEQNALRCAYKNACQDNDKQPILVKYIKSYMPEIIRSSTSRIIRESKFLKSTHHGVVRK